ncbi:MAG: hypothetical protein ACFE68_03080 [Candidatus Hodarchaeota archaeon]
MERVEEKDEKVKKKEEDVEEEEEEELGELDELLSELEVELESLESVEAPSIEEEVVEEIVVVERPPVVEEKEREERRVSEAIKEILPPWIDKPWMYIKPEKADHLESWLNDWGDFLVDLCRVMVKHVVNLMHLRSRFPFKNPICKKNLTLNHMQDVGEYLVSSERAAWWDSGRLRLRVYWMALEEWAEEIFQWAFERGETVVTFFDLVNAGERWSSLPPRDLKAVCEILVKKGQARWLDDKKKSLEFRFFDV